MSDDDMPLATIASREGQANSLDALIDQWWADHFPGSAVARETAAWNAVHAAKEALKRLLARAAPQAMAC